MDGEHIESEGTTEAAAAEALAEVAKEAIDNTAERIEALTLAVARIAHFEGELAELREAFRAHAEGNQVDFIAVREKLDHLEAGVTIMREALEEEADEIEDLLKEEIREETLAAAAAEAEEEEEEEAEEIDGVANVEEAEAREPPSHHQEHEEHHEHHEQRRHGRHFVRI